LKELAETEKMKIGLPEKLQQNRPENREKYKSNRFTKWCPL